jgi:hypothetical protein
MLGSSGASSREIGPHMASTAAAVAPQAKAAFWKLKGVYKWRTVAPYVTKVTVRFDPAGSGTSGVR